MQVKAPFLKKMFGQTHIKEKRSELRFPVVIRSSCFGKSTGEVTHGETHDISCAGVCVIASNGIPLGAQIEIIFVMSDTNELVERKGVVIWSVKYGDKLHRIGIRLEEPNLKPVPLVLRTIMAQTQEQQGKECA